MKALGRCIALCLVCAAVAAAPWAIRTTAEDMRQGTTPKVTQWKGVISVGWVPTFSMADADRWLKVCFDAFAREHGTAAASLREMTRMSVETGAAAGTLPDVLLFGQNVLQNPEDMLRIRDGKHAEPIARGGYALLGNRELLKKAGWEETMDFMQTAALCEEAGAGIAAPRREYTDPSEWMRASAQRGMAGMVTDRYARVWPDFVLEGRYALYVATQREILRMQTLQSAGRGFDAVLILPEEEQTDQVLLGGAVIGALTAQKEEEERAEWAFALIDHLIKEEQQAELVRAGLFPAVGIAGIYEQGTPMAQLEASLLRGMTE